MVQGTVYGLGNNNANACSYGTNAADVDGLPWTQAPSGAPEWPAGVTTTFIAMNNVDWGLSNICGACIWFKSEGALFVVSSVALSATSLLRNN